jgi:hypothetical protein
MPKQSWLNLNLVTAQGPSSAESLENSVVHVPELWHYYPEGVCNTRQLAK